MRINEDRIARHSSLAVPSSVVLPVPIYTRELTTKIVRGGVGGKGGSTGQVGPVVMIITISKES